MSELAAVVETGPGPATDGVVRWRRIDLRAVVERRFGIGLHERTVDKLHFAKLSVRPQHPASDADAQMAFKKTSPGR